MAEKTFLSPAVSTREIDLSQPTSIQPSGVPAGVIGTARRGPAFVPVTVATFQDFVAKFGNTDGESFGPLAMNEWMRNANAGTYVRLLGAGNAKARTDEGRVTNAGFIAGSAGVQANGKIGVNPYAVAGSDQLGRAYILGCFMADNGSSTVLTDSDLAGTGSQPIVRGVLMFPSGVVPTLSSVQTKGTNTAKATAVGGSADKPQGTAAGLGGGAFGDVNTSNDLQEFVLLLNGHVSSDAYVNQITASFDPAAPNSFKNVLNTDPTRIEEAGHYLYADWQISRTRAVITGSGITPYLDPTGTKINSAFIVPSSGSRNTLYDSTSDLVGPPNLDGFDDRFRTAFSPFVISQKFGGKNENLFRFHALDDGQAGSDTFKITIQNIIASIGIAMHLPVACPPISQLLRMTIQVCVNQ